ncbi:hypothetical protein J42TS3_46740 [Paenibacillus vini]|uniref:Uncharacterized protein n=1 Tax=Paenibacillus vini TaxID=1476024 RepID=A0ABQ4MI16_9BACL|nr:hypothetical protein J42TS3_46740 [Paenibacillus vini]
MPLALYLTEGWVTGKLLHGLMIQTYKYVIHSKSAPICSGVTFLFFYAHFAMFFLGMGYAILIMEPVLI